MAMAMTLKEYLDELNIHYDIVNLIPTPAWRQPPLPTFPVTNLLKVYC